MTPEQRLKMFNELEPVLQAVYSSEHSNALNNEIQVKYKLPLDTFRNFLTVSGDTILGFYHTKDLPKLLQKEVGVSADVAQRIVSDLTELFAPVLKREAELANPKLSEIKELHQTFQAAAGTGAGVPIEVPKSPTIEPIEPASVHDVAPMRTMAGDMNRVHGYGAYRQVGGDQEENVVQSASQDELLKTRQPLTEIPRVGE